MNGFCLGMAFALAQALIPAERLTLAWNHSVERLRWEEDYVIRDGALVLVEARVQGNGAGMEPPPEAQWRDGWWRYRPQLAPLPKLVLTRSPYVADYTLCWDGRCRPLAAVLDAPPPAGEVVEMFACRPSPDQPGGGSPALR